MTRQILELTTRTALCQALLCASSLALALECPDPPKQTQKDWDNEIKASVGRIGPVKGAELDARVKSTTQNLLGKLPSADRLYMEQMMFSAYCTALRDDTAMLEAEKARQILEYRRALMTALRK